jgi:iron(III) transport system substrate-binding protein
MDPQGLYIASTGSARGIVYHKELIPAAQAPKGWEDCIDPKYRGKIIYDTRDRLAAFQHDPKTREWFLKWLKGLVANKVVLNRGMEENLQKVAAGEFLISCVANYHNAMPMINEGAPLVFVFPDPYTSDIATEIHVLSWSKTPITTQLFALWLATKAQPLIEKITFRGFPWVPGTQKYTMTKGKYMALCAADCASKAEQYDQEHAKIIGLPGRR